MAVGMTDRQGEGLVSVAGLEGGDDEPNGPQQLGRPCGRPGQPQLVAAKVASGPRATGPQTCYAEAMEGLLHLTNLDRVF
jgi:hypothetical protein